MRKHCPRLSIQMLRAWTTAFALVVLLCPWSAGATTQSAAPDSCAALAAPAGVVFSALPAWVDSPELPEYCRVTGTIDGRVTFEMRLPQQWSGRFMMAGCGGFCGALIPDKPGHSNAINEALKRGYAAISHDSGHRAQSWETHWARDREALELWAHKALPVVAGVGTQLASDMYGQAPRYKYFSGCSNGGRMGLMAAQRYPGLFDGIAAGGSIFELSGIAGLWGNWLIVTNQAGMKSRFPQAKVPFLQALVMKQCDAVDGLTDGIIDDPRACQVDFTAAVCPSPSTSADGCLSGQEAQLLGRLYGGVKNGKGETVYPAVVPGSEYYSDKWLFGTDGQPGWGVMASAGYRQMLAADLSELDVPAGLATDQMLDWIGRSSIPKLTDATDPDLSELREQETKLLIYHGWSDPLIIPEPIIHYYQRAAEAAGGLQQLQRNARLFMVPGWGHCWEQPAAAPDDFDPLFELEQWVEQARPPQFMVARQLDAAGVEQRSRPICAYPSVVRLKAGKNPDKYDSYECVNEDAPRG
jgi:pimeloyl-ACP methyl ester carboxylesterase